MVNVKTLDCQKGRDGKLSPRGGTRSPIFHLGIGALFGFAFGFHFGFDNSQCDIGISKMNLLHTGKETKLDDDSESGWKVVNGTFS